VKRARRLVIVVFLSAGILFAWALADRNAREHNLRGSLEVLLTTRLNASYVMERESLIAETDAIGLWRIRVSVPSAMIHQAMLNSGFGPASTDNSDYWKGKFRRFDPTTSFDDFTLFAAEFVSGPGTTCDEFPCDVQILFKDGDPNLYVAIVKY